MEFQDSDVSSNTELDDAQSSGDGYDSPGEGVEDILQKDNETPRDDVGDIPDINKVPIENPSVGLGITGAEPSIGMSFDSWEAAQVFYNDYAKHIGFSVRIRDGKRSKAPRGIRIQDRPFITREFVCSREGYCRKADDHTRGEGVQHMTARTGCVAKLTVKKEKDSGKWKVTKLEKTHNHEMVTPSKSWYLRSHRRLSRLNKGFLLTAASAHAMPIEITNFSSQTAGGPSHVAYNGNQFLDSMHKFKKSRLLVNDAETVHEYCQRMSFEDPEFSYTIQTDIEGRMTNFFWIHGRAKLAYKYFGDVVIFDTTYRKNKYKMPFVLFIGVNHHRRNILFGCALLQDETEATFTWLFRTWLQAVSSSPPVSIITEQNDAIEGAIKNVFLTTCHRFCSWNITEKFFEHFSDYRKNESFKTDFHKCLHKTYSEEEFELCWKELAQRYGMENHSYIKLMYSIRKQWVPTFLRGSFFAGLQLSQRSDSTQRMLGRVLKSSTTLQEFIENFKEVEDKRYEDENHDDFIDTDKLPVMKTQFSIEKNAANIYTKELFKKFQAQLFSSCGYSFEVKQRNEEEIVYDVTKDEEGFRTYIVIFNSLERRVTCSCQMFEYVGILCRHALNVLNHHQIRTIPSDYVLRRWTKDASKEDMDGGTVSIHSLGNKATLLRYTDVMQDCKIIAQMASKHVETHQLFKSRLKMILEEISAVNSRPVEPESPNHKAT